MSLPGFSSRLLCFVFSSSLYNLKLASLSIKTCELWLLSLYLFVSAKSLHFLPPPHICSPCLEERVECCQGHLPFKTLMGTLRVCLLSLGVAWALRFSSVDSRSLEWSLNTESPSDEETLPRKDTQTQPYMNNWSPRAHEHAAMSCIIKNCALAKR